ncbi:MAG: hypothetical protein AAF902_18020 [Chloroflexota bacterium]
MAGTYDLIPASNVEGFLEYAPAIPLLLGYERNGNTILVEHAYGETEIPAEGFPISLEHKYGSTTIDEQPLRAALPAAQQGREIFLNYLVGGAFSFSSPLSLEFLLDEMMPMIEAAMDGDPTTEVP